MAFVRVKPLPFLLSGIFFIHYFGPDIQQQIYRNARVEVIHMPTKGTVCHGPVLQFLSVLAGRNAWFLCTLWLTVSCVCCRGHDPTHTHTHTCGNCTAAACHSTVPPVRRPTGDMCRQTRAMKQHDVHVSGGRRSESPRKRLVAKLIMTVFSNFDHEEAG